MDTENNFDSDTSESWSLIDLNCERSADINSMDEIGAEALEARLEEVEGEEKSSASPGGQEKDGSPENTTITGNDGNNASGNLKNRPVFKRLYDGPLFEDESDGELYAPGGYEKYFSGYGANMDAENKDADDDTDGISVISESEINEGKVNAYESDEVWDEKPSDSDANENPGLNNLKKGKAPKVDPGESSGDKANSDIAPEESGGSKDTNVEKKEVDNLRQPQVIARFVFRYRNHNASFARRLVSALILTGILYIMIGCFSGKEDSLQTADNMALKVKKLQKENLILHSKLNHLNRAVLARGVNKLDIKEETQPDCLKDQLDCSKTNLKLNERNTDEGNYDFSDPRNKDSLDFSIPLNHPKNVLAFKQILGGNEVARKSDDNYEPFNFSKYMEALVGGRYNEENPSAPTEATEPMELAMEKFPDPETEKLSKRFGKIEEHFEIDGPKPEEDETPRENCLAIEEKDLSQFRWFILKDKPKCTEINVEDLDELGPDCLYRIPMEKIYRKANTDAFEDSDKATAQTDVLEGKDDEFIPSETASALPVDLKSTHDRDNLKENKPKEKDSQMKKMKKGEINLAPGKRYFDHGPGSPKKKGKDEKEKFEFAGYEDKYLKYFEQVEKEILEKNGRIKECIMGKNGRCVFKFREPGENNLNENFKKNGEKRRNGKRDQYQKGKKDKADLRCKKWKTCKIKPDLKCGNDSKCDDCSCKTGDWFSRYAEGREKCRRDQKISDWQFDRAKSREHSRMGDAFWQFSRADGRQNRRMYPYSRKKKAKHSSGKGPAAKPDSQI